MNSIFALFSHLSAKQQSILCIGEYAMTQTAKQDANRESDNFDRNASLYSVKVNACDNGNGANRARLYLCAMDGNTKDIAKDRRHFTDIVLADWTGSRFVKRNAKFECRLTREAYDALRAIGACRETDDLRKSVLVDFTRVSVFENIGAPDAAFVADKLAVLRAQETRKKLKSILDYYRDKAGLKESRGPRGPRDPNKVTVCEPYSALVVTLPSESVDVVIQSSDYRDESRKPYQYTAEQVERLEREIAEQDATIERLRQSVRIRELSYTEHCGVGEYTVEVDGRQVVVEINTCEAVYKDYGVLRADAQRHCEEHTNCWIDGEKVAPVAAV